MPMKRTPRQRRAAEQRRRQAEQAARREEHARLVVERSGDPRFVQRHRGDDGGKVYTWDAESSAGQDIQRGFAAQREAFRARFGREPGPEDPVFFDPNADEPTPIGDQQHDEMFDAMMAAATNTGLDPAFIRAWRDVGYIVTEQNRHLFSAAEVEAYGDAVASHQEVDGEDDSAVVTVVADGLRALVDQMVESRSAEPARALAQAADSTGEADAQELLVVFGFGVLMAWLAGARETLGGEIAIPALDWVGMALGENLRSMVLPLSGVLGHPEAPDLTVNEALDEVGDQVLPALLYLVAGVVATALGGDAERLMEFDPQLGD